MSPRHTDVASRLTSALTGASVALGIAREATDAVPIVKQVLGAALRIVGLAEKMDNDREALRALGASSLQLARQVTAVMAGKTPNGGIQESLERILKALDDIEKFMKEHATRNRLRRIVSYAFTVPQHVKRLSGELADAVRDLTVVALLDVDKQVHATHSAVEDNARFDGEFRLLRHCEVQKLDRVFYQQDEDENAVVRYHRAQVDGQLLVVRYFEGSIPQESSSVQIPNDRMFNRIAVHDTILEEISSVQRSHPNVARIYGWSRGSGRDRFTVFKAGYQSFESLLDEFPNPLFTGIHWAFKLLDAVQHLELMGIVWYPSGLYTLDDQLQPIIGLQNDLGRIDMDVDHLFVAHSQIFYITLPLRQYAEQKLVPAAQILTDCPTEPLADLLGRMEPILRDRYIFPRAEFSDHRILTDATAKRLLRIFNDEALRRSWIDESWIWANIALALEKNRSHALIRSYRAVYFPHTHGADFIRLYGMDHDSERVVYDTYYIRIPGEQKDEVREMFGISAPCEEELMPSHVIATGTYRMILD